MEERTAIAKRWPAGVKLNRLRGMWVWGGIWTAGAVLALTFAGCGRGATAEATDESAQSSNAPAAVKQPAPALEQEGLLIGEFRLAKDPVVDGDTIRVQGIARSVRLLSIDTEERLLSKAGRKAVAEDFEQYLARKRGNAPRPKKAGTPMGEEATRFAKAFFEGADTVRLERDAPKDIRGRYGRPLAYAFVRKNGRWTSYNVEAVRAGMSPYFTKYGYSRRFHNQLAHAELEARRAKRGIWNPDAQGYGDYDERKAWWNARAELIRTFEHEANQRDDYIRLTEWDAPERLEKNLGKRVTVLSTVDGIQRFKRLVRVQLAGARGERFPIIFFDEALFRESGIARYRGEPVMIRGEVERYEKGDYRTLQIVVRDPEQVSLPPLPWPDPVVNATE